jgi:hypothetical protein
LDSNQQPADYRSVSSIDEKRRIVAQRQRASMPNFDRKAA